ncbi:unnamed protein product [Mycena citricolor]|uniref:PH domain-containing protein n=1 Tax=Mycena citricolor TaxID=2018698 RepID=A0AAD2HLJ1_9AGAR|nr:unnamed protein product [Mycena citricolor]
MQQNSAHFEEGIVRAIQSAWQTYDEWQARMSQTVSTIHTELTTHMSSLAPDREWLAFSGRSDHLLDPDTPLRNPLTINYPSKEDTSVQAVHTGMLERKKRFTRTYREHYFVLTPAGFLHEYASADPLVAREPVFSLFLPMCTLGPPSNASAKSHKFHIEGRKDGSGTTKSGSVRRSLSITRLSGGDHAWSFRSRSREDMMEWWNDIRMLCARYLVASEQMERSGPVAAAVRSAGYISDEEDSEEGSSIDEEDDDDELEYVDVHEEMGPPSYSNGPHALEMGANGYPVSLVVFLSPDTSRMMILQVDKKGHSRNPSAADGGANVSRRPSKRQQEKAPEGRPPHAAEEPTAVPEPPVDDAAAAPPVESRFHEDV